jgi:outer membrane receptor protein involved in Fe transport
MCLSVQQYVHIRRFGGMLLLAAIRDMIDEWRNENTGSIVLGDVRTWGFELEAGYHTDKWKVDVSHSYTKLKDIDVHGAGEWWSQFSAEPYGFGNDLAQWHNHTSKLRAEYKFDDKLSVNGALCVLWGNPGGEDWAKLRDSIFPNWDYDAGFDNPFKCSAYLNLGLEYKLNPNAIITLTGYNLLGMFDKELNKRRIGFNEQMPGTYRIQPAAFSGSLTYRF